MQLIHFAVFICCSLAASAPVLDLETSTTRYNVGASIALLRLGDSGTCEFDYVSLDLRMAFLRSSFAVATEMLRDQLLTHFNLFLQDCPDSNKPICIHCPGDGPNNAGWCSNLNNSPENNLCADKFYSEYCGTQHCLNGAEVETPAEDVGTEGPVYEGPEAFASGDEQHALQIDPDRYLSEASVPQVYEDYREIDFD